MSGSRGLWLKKKLLRGVVSHVAAEPTGGQGSHEVSGAQLSQWTRWHSR